ncbi:MAG: acetylxylan esterase [Armatimonadetes bacterium]|nr:acetylxylan esterase [Armatimonadota bacterium]
MAEHVVRYSANQLTISDEPAVRRLAEYYALRCAPRPLAYRSRAAWVARRSEVRRQARAALGIDPAPERLPLDVREGGTLVRSGYEVRRLYWQTWPGVYASGWLYRPAPLSGRAPAVLNLHGHWPGGAAHPVVQSRLIGLARLGYVALAVDAIHLYGYEVGVNPAGVMTWNNMRALDLLTSMPEVDPERIGVTGASGGGLQTMYLLALDDRPRAAVPAAMITYFHRILSPESHPCACHYVPGIMREMDALELIAVFAPKPLLFLTVERDWTRLFPQHELLEFRSLYRLYGQPDRLDHEQFPGGHDYSRPMRERMYAWFERWLRGREGAVPAEPEHEPEPPESLHVLDCSPPEHRGWDAVIDYYRERAVRQPPRLESRATRKRWQDDLRAALRDLVGDAEPPAALELQTHARMSSPGYRLEKISFASEPAVRIPALLLVPEGAQGAPAAVLLHPGGKAGWFRDGRLDSLPGELLAAGWVLLLPDVRLRGELALDWQHNCLIWGRPEAGMAARDALTAVDLLYRLPEVDWRRLLLVGVGDQGVGALLASGWDERVAAVVADCVGTAYRDGGEGLPLIPNILRVGDVPQIAALSAPRPLWLFNVPSARMNFPSLRYYDFARRMYQSLGAAEALRMIPTQSGPLAVPTASGLQEWLAHQWRRLPRA